MKLKFWSSGHSTDYAMIATYETELDAIAAMKKVGQTVSNQARALDEGFRWYRYGKKLFCEVFVNGPFPMKLRYTISSSNPRPISVLTFSESQHLKIRVETSSPLSVFPLLTDQEETKAMGYLKRLSNSFRELQGMIEFEYRGEPIHVGEGLFLPHYGAHGFIFDLSDRPNWKISQLKKEMLK